ncbi:MAG: PIN domain-containing protein [Aggregatilineales bacterium]
MELYYHYLLDTNIFIDVLRGYPPAIDWLKSLSASSVLLSVPVIVRMELILGTRNKIEQQRITKLLDEFSTEHIAVDDSKWAMEQFEDLYLSHQIEIMDCLIGAIAFRLKTPIFTRNKKHFAPLPDVEVRIPYS